jgi:hypothetical protein
LFPTGISFLFPVAAIDLKSEDDVKTLVNLTEEFQDHVMFVNELSETYFVLGLKHFKL